MGRSALGRVLLGVSVLSLAACAPGDRSTPSGPSSTKVGTAAAAPAVAAPALSVPATTEGTKPAGFEAVIRVDPKPNGDGLIVGDAPLVVEFDACGSRSGDGQPLTYLYDWDRDHLADAIGRGDDCRRQHTYTTRKQPDASGHVLVESNVCVVSGNPRVHGPDTYFSCRHFGVLVAVSKTSTPVAGLRIQVEGHADVGVPCDVGDYSCQAHYVCNAVTGYECLFQQYDCAYGPQGSWYPPDGNSGGDDFNFAYTYDFVFADYGNICACTQSQMSLYGLAATHDYCGLGHWTRR